jgi:hypothetical protein
MLNKNSFFIAFLLFFLLTSCQKESVKVVKIISPIDTTVNYIESDSVILNPERGFYTEQDFYSSDNNVLTTSAVKAARLAGESLIQTMYYLNDFLYQPISNAFLNRIKQNMQALRDGGCKGIIRFAYSSDNNLADSSSWDASQDIVQIHIHQLASILNDYSDVIYVLQAGFIGVWGEWYYTDHFNFNPISVSDYAPRKALLDTLLRILPKNRMIAVRTPESKVYSFNIPYSDTITLLTAYTGSDLSRIACHNDALLSDGSDMGTFLINSDRTFWQSESKYVSMGGETDELSGYSDWDNAVIAMQNYHWSYLNADYFLPVINKWNSENYLDTIKNRLGYRFVLTEGKFTRNAIAGQEYDVQITLKNVGFAAPVNPRNVEIVFISKEDTATKYKIQLSDDPRYWFAGGTYMISTKFGLPVDMPLDDYDIYLNLPDPSPTLTNRAEFSIRTANSNTWNSIWGYNKLITIKVINSSATNPYNGIFLTKI